jgi:raffinose synthase
MRTSTDFWPDIPKSHGFHLYTNAQVSLWFGQFVHPDWDMFASGHPKGAYHAAARAISGGPVYVADAPEQVDAGLLRKLVAADGGIFRCRDIARPCLDCLMHDPTREPVLLKLFNRNAHGSVIGVFHAQTGDDAATPLSGAVSPSDIPGWACGRAAVWAHRAGTLAILEPGESLAVVLDPGEWELFTLAPFEDGLAVLGLADKFNSGGAVVDLEHRSGSVAFRLLDGGRLALASASRPSAITCDGVPVAFEYDAATGAAVAVVPAAGSVVVQL